MTTVNGNIPTHISARAEAVPVAEPIFERVDFEKRVA